MLKYSDMFTINLISNLLSYFFVFMRIEQTPPLMASGPIAFYFGGSPDGSRPGVYYVRTTNLKGRSAEA